MGYLLNETGLLINLKICKFNSVLLSRADIQKEQSEVMDTLSASVRVGDPEIKQMVHNLTRSSEFWIFHCAFLALCTGCINMHYQLPRRFISPSGSRGRPLVKSSDWGKLISWSWDQQVSLTLLINPSGFYHQWNCPQLVGIEGCHWNHGDIF